MPIRYKYKYKNKPKRYAKKGGSNTIATLAKEVASIKKKVKVQAPELYYWTRNSVVNNAAVTTTGLAHSMCLAAEEDDAATAGTPVRVGNEITWVKAQYRGYLRWVTTSSGGVVTFLIVRVKKQAPSTYPAFSDMFEGGDANYGLTLDKKRADVNFQILYKKRYVQNDDVDEIPIEWNIDLKGLKSYYSGPTATAIQDNGIYFMIQSNKATNQPLLALNERIYYYQ